MNKKNVEIIVSNVFKLKDSKSVKAINELFKNTDYKLVEIDNNSYQIIIEYKNGFLNNISSIINLIEDILLNNNETCCIIIKEIYDETTNHELLGIDKEKKKLVIKFTSNEFVIKNSKCIDLINKKLDSVDDLYYDIVDLGNEGNDIIHYQMSGNYYVDIDNLSNITDIIATHILNALIHFDEDCVVCLHSYTCIIDNVYPFKQFTSVISKDIVYNIDVNNIINNSIMNHTGIPNDNIYNSLNLYDCIDNEQYEATEIILNKNNIIKGLTTNSSINPHLKSYIVRKYPGMYVYDIRTDDTDTPCTLENNVFVNKGGHFITEKDFDFNKENDYIDIYDKINFHGYDISLKKSVKKVEGEKIN